MRLHSLGQITFTNSCRSRKYEDKYLDAAANEEALGRKDSLKSKAKTYRMNGEGKMNSRLGYNAGKVSHWLKEENILDEGGHSAPRVQIRKQSHA